MDTTQILHLDTSELKSGDIVLTYGMRVLLGERRTYEGDREPVYQFDGTVTNLEEVLEEGFVPASWLHHWTFVEGHRTLTRKDRWVIQGNRFARWSVERN